LCLQLWSKTQVCPFLDIASWSIPLSYSKNVAFGRDQLPQIILVILWNNSCLSEKGHYFYTLKYFITFWETLFRYKWSSYYFSKRCILIISQFIYSLWPEFKSCLHHIKDLLHCTTTWFIISSLFCTAKNSMIMVFSHLLYLTET
jgi:hypothetical protein